MKTLQKSPLSVKFGEGLSIALMFSLCGWIGYILWVVFFGYQQLDWTIFPFLAAIFYYLMHVIKPRWFMRISHGFDKALPQSVPLQGAAVVLLLLQCLILYYVSQPT